MTLRGDGRSQWTVPALLRSRAAERPSDVAHQTVGGEALTFAAWDDLSDAAAGGLAARGVTPGDRILLPCSAAGWTAYAVAWAAVLKAGAVAVPVPESAGMGQLLACGEAAGAAGCVGEMGVDLPGGFRTTVAELTGDPAAKPPEVTVMPGSDAEIIYTSGTTGVPKGVVATHANLVHALVHSQARQRCVALHALPPGTTVGQGLLVQPLGPAPHSVLTLPRFAPRDFLLAIERCRPSHVVLVPAMAIALVGSAAAGRYDLGCVRQVRTTSAAIHPATLEQLARMFPEATIRNVYSTTECWPRRVATDYDRARPRSLGRPTGGSQLRITGPDGREVPPGVPGDVQLRSDAPVRRYAGDPAAASAVFLPGGWVRTGDTGMTDADGYFYLVDRNPDLVITGGLNVSTLDLEAVIMDYPGVIEAAVCGVPHPVLGECVMAAVRAEPGVDAGALTDYLRERRGAAAPRRVVLTGDLPRTLLGKVDKQRLRAQLAAQPGGEAAEQPVTPTERALAGIWAAALGCGQVLASDDFLYLGGSSLTAMEVTTQVEADLGKRVHVRDLLDCASLREFAQRVDAAPAVDAVPAADAGGEPAAGAPRERAGNLR